MFIVRVFSWFPLWVLYRLSDISFVLIFYVLRYRREIVWKNLSNSFPEKTKAEIHSIQKEFYRNLCDHVAETIKLLTISKEELTRRMNYADVDQALKYSKKGQSVIVLASHQFNWEWLVAVSNISFPMPIDYVYQKQSNRFANHFSNVVRSRFGAFPISRDAVARESIKRKNILRGIAIVADQYPGLKNDKLYQSTFLNQETVFFQGVNQLAILTQYPVVFASIKKIKRGYYKVDFPEIATPPYDKNSSIVMEKYVANTEKLIRENPSDWLWSHNRWKKKHLR